MIMDEPSLYRPNPTWYSSPVHGIYRMSWEQSSHADDREAYRFSSNTNTPQRGPATDTNADEARIHDVNAVPSPFPGGQHPYYGGYSLDEHAPNPFPDFGNANYSGHQWPPPHQPVAALPPREQYEEEEDTDISPPPALKRTVHNFELSLSHSTSSPSSGGSSGASLKLKFSHESSSPEQEAVPEHRDASEQKSAERVHGTTVPHPSEFAFAVPQARAGTSPDVAYAASTMYAFDDSALNNPNAGQHTSPIKQIPVQAARKPPPKKKSTKAKAKRPSRRSTKQAAGRKKAASAAGQSTSEKPRFVPTKEELIEANTPRAQQALRTWYQRLGELHEYKKANGHCSVPQKYPKNPPLGTWVNKQRMEYKMYQEGGKHSLTAAKLHKLNSIGFDWGKRKGDHSWEIKFNELKEYKEENGDCLVPTKYAENPALGRWVSTQRSQYKLYIDGVKCTMTKERAERLASIGFVWNMLPVSPK